MKVIRFVTEAELQAYLIRGKLMNIHNHAQYHSTSVGFCFAELTEERDADKWLRKLMYIRPCEYCIEFDTDYFATPLTESIAQYADDTDFAHKRADFREWCTTDYSLDTHPYTRIGRCPTLIQLAMGWKIEWVSYC